MSALLLRHVPEWPPLAALGTYLAAGMILGLLYFRALWWNVCQFAGGGRAGAVMSLMIGRFLLMAGCLLLVSLMGAVPLLAMLLGVLAARAVMMRRCAKAAP